MSPPGRNGEAATGVPDLGVLDGVHEAARLAERLHLKAEPARQRLEVFVDQERDAMAPQPPGRRPVPSNGWTSPWLPLGD